jgi:D-aminoacyl-tRNA deacylase
VLIEQHGFREKTKTSWINADDIELIDTNAETVLDVPTDFDTDYLLVLSSHKSKTAGKMITAHFPGNWGDAKMGGEQRTLNIAHCSALKLLVQSLFKSNKTDWPVLIEADHHGPTPENSVPVIFVEIGSTEEEWADKAAAESVADAISMSIARKNHAHPPYEFVFGVGGGHYAREFTQLVLESNYAVGHIAPKYAIEQLDEQMFEQAIRKNVEQIKQVAVLQDSTNRQHKEKIEAFCKKYGVEYAEVQGKHI